MMHRTGEAEQYMGKQQMEVDSQGSGSSYLHGQTSCFGSVSLLGESNPDTEVPLASTSHLPHLSGESKLLVHSFVMSCLAGRICHG